MNSKPTIFSFLSHIFFYYGITMLIMNILCVLFGENAQQVSEMFSLGSAGLSVKTSCQILLLTTLLETAETLFMTDVIIKKMPFALRVSLMLTSTFLITVIFILICRWFPVHQTEAWILFVVMFALCCFFSTIISILKERKNNRILEEAFNRMKMEEQK